MIKEAVLITLSCTLFVQMGLSEAIQTLLHIKFKIASCPRCLTYWCCLAWLIFSGTGLLQSVATAFIASYCALWLSLIYDALALLYNYLYEQITKTTDTTQVAEDAADSDKVASGNNEVSQM